MRDYLVLYLIPACLQLVLLPYDRQVFQSGDYGVGPGDSTFQIIKKHSRFIHDKINSRPPRAECGYSCWVPQTVWSLNTCRNVPSACEAYWAADARGAALPSGPFFTSKDACCKAGLGAYEAGCTWML